MPGVGVGVSLADFLWKRDSEQSSSDDALSGALPVHAHLILPLPVRPILHGPNPNVFGLLLHGFVSRSLFQLVDHPGGYWVYGAAVEWYPVWMGGVGFETGVIKENRGGGYADHPYYGIAVRIAIAGSVN